MLEDHVHGAPWVAEFSEVGPGEDSLGHREPVEQVPLLLAHASTPFGEERLA